MLARRQKSVGKNSDIGLDPLLNERNSRIFFEYFTRKKRGRGGIHTQPSVGLRAINPLFTIFFGQKWILHVKISMGTR